MMDRVQDRHLEKTVKLSYSKISPQAIFKDPFRGGNNILVVCDAYTPAGEPIPTNKRHRAAPIFSDPKVVAEVPWYGIEQEYTLLQTNVKWPLGWPVGGYPGPQVPTIIGPALIGTATFLSDTQIIS